MISAALMLFANTLLFSLRLDRSGSFPRPLSASEERMWLERLAQGDPEARNVLIERNLRLVAHIVLSNWATICFARHILLYCLHHIRSVGLLNL